MADLLNFYKEFENETGIAGKLIPEILFGDGYAEQIDFNPNHTKVTSDYGLINGAVPSNMKDVEDGESKFQLEMKRWYRTNRQHKLDRQLSAFDANDCIVDHYCAPVTLATIIGWYWMLFCQKEILLMEAL